MKRNLLHLLLILSVPVWLMFSAAAQEGGDTGAKSDPSAVEEGKDVTPEKKSAPSGTEVTPKKTEKQADRKKKAARKSAPVTDDRQKAAPAEETADDGTGNSLLLIDHEKIKYDRIPGITIKSDDKEQESIVNIPDEKISGEAKKKKNETEGIFGKNTRAIAGWGIVILIFLLFVIYSKTRSRKSKRKVVRIVPKR
jgi:hypothetical protein